jgi:hypothetical protein
MDLGLVAQTAQRVGSVPEVRSGGERVTVDTKLLLPLLQASATGMSGELARDLRAAVAARDVVTLVLPSGVGQGEAVRMEAGLRQFPIPAALRDALLSALGRNELASSGGTTSLAAATVATSNAGAAAMAGAADTARTWAVAATTTAAAAVMVSGSGASRSVHRARDDGPVAQVKFSQPLFEPIGEVHATEPIAERLRHQVERSGLFFESHVAQWLRGARDVAELRVETLGVAATSDRSAAESSAQRVAAQVALLQEGQFVLRGPAWPGQPAAITIQREEESSADSPGLEPVFNAQLALDLPHLGPLRVNLRLSGQAVGATVTSADASPIAPALDELAERLRIRGLTPVLMQAVAAPEVA